MSDYGLHKNDKNHEIDRSPAPDLAGLYQGMDMSLRGAGRVGEEDICLAVSSEWVVSLPPRRPLLPTTTS